MPTSAGSISKYQPDAKHAFPLNYLARMEQSAPGYLLKIVDGDINSEKIIEPIQENEDYFRYGLNSFFIMSFESSIPNVYCS